LGVEKISLLNCVFLAGCGFCIIEDSKIDKFQFIWAKDNATYMAIPTFIIWFILFFKGTHIDVHKAFDKYLIK